jgi:hypothetical protein
LKATQTHQKYDQHENLQHHLKAKTEPTKTTASFFQLLEGGSNSFIDIKISVVESNFMLLAKVYILLTIYTPAS